MPCSRHSSGTGVPVSACFRIAMIWLSVNRDFFIEFPCCENSTSDHCGFVGGLPLHLLALIICKGFCESNRNVLWNSGFSSRQRSLNGLMHSGFFCDITLH